MFRKSAILAGVLALPVALAGCATKAYAPEEAPELVTITDFSGFYRLGPLQSRGPDVSLKAGTRVKLLRKEMGYSLVMLEDQRTGYIANESLVPAPPRPPSRDEDAAVAGQDGSPSPGRRSGGRYTGEQVNDSALPEPAPPPSLDLDIGPEDMVEAPPATPPQENQGPPKFRY